MYDPSSKSNESAERLRSLYRASTVSSAALVCGGAAAAAVYFWAPLRDPVDVVGVPLLTGYSEAAEHWAFFAFFLVSSVSALAFARVEGSNGAQVLVGVEPSPEPARQRSTERSTVEPFVMPAGAMCLLGLACAGSWSEAPLALVPTTFVGVVGFVLGARCGTAPTIQSGWFAALAFAVWAITYPQLPLELAANGLGLAILAAGALGWLGARFRGDARSVAHVYAALRLGAAIVVVLGSLSANVTEFWQGLATIGAYWLGVGASRRGESPASSDLYQGQSIFVNKPWLLCVALLAGVLIAFDDWWMVPAQRPVLAAVGGLGAAIVLHQFAAVLVEATSVARAPGDRHLPGFCEAVRQRSTRFVRLGRLVPQHVWRWLVVAAIAGTAFDRPWFGVTAALLAAGIWLLRRPRRGRTAAGCAAATILVVFLPAPPQQFDPFHDGQILSAVWSFESGKALYSEVFPLRGFDFFATWLGQQVLEPSIAAHQRTHQLLTFLPLAGFVLAAYAWTRSIAWSVASALVLSAFWATGGRMGLQLLLAAWAIVAFRSSGRYRGLRLAIGGLPAAFGGYDVLLPYAAAAVAGVAVASSRRRASRYSQSPGVGSSDVNKSLGAWQRGIRTAAGACGEGAAVLAGIIVPFTCVVCVWQGIPAVVEFWRLLVDNARNLPAFYGLPLPWSGPHERIVMVTTLTIVGLWGVALAFAWPRLPERRRGAWVFVFVHAVIHLCRAVGRSDFAHLHVAVYPAVFLGSIGSFELLRWLRQGGIGGRLDRSLIAGIVAAAAAWMTPAETRSLWEFLHDLQQTQPTAEPLLPQPEISERLTASDTLWDIERGHLNYVYQRHNPTRHALAYCISSSAEQRQAVAALQRNPAKLIAWQFQSGSDGIANPLRYYAISGYLFEHYRPSPALMGFLEPAPAGWEGMAEVPQSVTDVLSMGWLPDRWGSDRLEDVCRRMLQERPLRNWQPIAIENVGSERHVRAGWMARGLALPRGFNYLKLDVAASGEEPGAADVEATLEFAGPLQEFRAEDRITFSLRADGERRCYVLPAGCSPGWSWRPVIDDLRLSVPANVSLKAPAVMAWRVDELRD